MDDADPEWDTVLQYISDPNDFPSPQSERPVSEMTGVLLNTQHPTPVQVLTPPGSDETSHTPQNPQEGLPQDHPPGNAIVSVSTTFHPGAALLPIPPDLVFLSTDGVLFYAHTTQVLASSTNYFDDLVPPKLSKFEMRDDHFGSVVPLPESASVFNIVLHVVYDISCAHYHPAVGTLIAAIEVMAKYGMPPRRHITPSTPLYSLILGQAPMKPIAVYALAAAHDIYDLAVPVSSHLLSFALHALTDDLTIRIGPVYLRRLLFLHLGRQDALKRLLLPAPHPHPPTSTCDFAEQKKLTRAWALASAYLAWDARPDLSTSAMEGAFLPLADHLFCDVCKRSLADRVRQLIVRWSMVKRSI
ncbi:hypothetical protein LXA43DRAFT_1165152 [Ganoderma leucocontextum]|nr:hypothetical protein LXA43DRAFT_1165152 [Ganoderma leucocontextum]